MAQHTRDTCGSSWRFIALIGLFALLISACTTPPVQLTGPIVTPSPPSSEAQDTEPLRLISWMAPTTLNPHLSPNPQDFLAARITYEPLASFDRNGKLVAFLAAEIPSEHNGGLSADKRSVTWRLKHDLRWSDGAPFTAADVRFTYTYITHPAVASHARVAYSTVQRVEALDDYTVKVTFKQPTIAWATPFVGRYGLILPHHIFATYNGANSRTAPANMQPVGTGPYRVVSFRSEEALFLDNRIVETNKVVYEPNPYFRDPNKLAFSRIELRGWGLPELSASAVIEDGTADYVYDVQVSDHALKEMESQAKGVAEINFGSRLLVLVLNGTDPTKGSNGTPHPFMSDPNVRQAIAHAINRQAIVDAIYGRMGRPAGSVLATPGEEQGANDVIYPYDMQQAAALLAAAGWIDRDGDGIRERDGISLQITYQIAAGPVPLAVHELIKQNLEALGFAVSANLIAAGVVQGGSQADPNTIQRFPADIQQILIAGESPELDTYLASWTCDQIPRPENNWQGMNTPRWCDSEYDMLYAQATAEIQNDRRQQLFAQMSERLVRESYVIPIAQIANVTGLNRTMQGFAWTPWDADVWDIQDWRKEASQ
ncbi:MAG: peptide ABC transporter substrate-binding protein [Oscillochloris sp.]|nr:peptide ABC transporter substrate-binding protein [Oscillochloris sp.]